MHFARPFGIICAMKYTRTINSVNGSFFLFGPRGTGKSTWLHDKFPDALFIDLLREDVKVRLEANPERLA